MEFKFARFSGTFTLLSARSHADALVCSRAQCMFPVVKSIVPLDWTCTAIAYRGSFRSDLRQYAAAENDLHVAQASLDGDRVDPTEQRHAEDTSSSSYTSGKPIASPS